MNERHNHFHFQIEHIFYTYTRRKLVKFQEVKILSVRCGYTKKIPQTYRPYFDQFVIVIYVPVLHALWSVGYYGPTVLIVGRMKPVFDEIFRFCPRACVAQRLAKQARVQNQKLVHIRQGCRLVSSPLLYLFIILIFVSELFINGGL